MTIGCFIKPTKALHKRPETKRDGQTKGLTYHLQGSVLDGGLSGDLVFSDKQCPLFLVRGPVLQFLVAMHTP